MSNSLLLRTVCLSLAIAIAAIALPRSAFGTPNSGPAAGVYLPVASPPKNFFVSPIELNGYNNNTGAVIDLGNSVLITSTSGFAYVPAGNSPNQIGVTGVWEGRDYAGGNSASAYNSYAAFRDAWADGYNSLGNNSYGLPWDSPNGIVSNWVANSPYTMGIGWINVADERYARFNGVSLANYDPAGKGSNLSIYAPAYIGDAFLDGEPGTDTLDLINAELAAGAAAGHPGIGVNLVSGQPRGQATWEDGDFFDQGYVTNADLVATETAIQLAQQGKLPPLGYDPVTVPEPGAFALLVASVVAAAAACRRWK